MKAFFIKLNDFVYACWSKFMTVFGDIRVSFTLAKVTAHDIREAERLAKPGDAILRKFNAYLDGKLIPAKEYSHSGTKVDGYNMMHSVAEGVQKVDLIDFIKDADGFVILRPRYKSPESVEDVVKQAYKIEGTPYDFLFNSADKSRLYCHEATCLCILAGGIEIKPKTVTYAFVSRECIIDECFLDTCDIVYESNSHGTKCLSRNPKARMIR